MNKSKIGYLIIASAIVWGSVIIGCAFVLKGTPYKEEVNRILCGGVIFHFLFVWNPLEKYFKKDKPKQDIDKTDSSRINLRSKF